MATKKAKLCMVRTDPRYDCQLIASLFFSPRARARGGNFKFNFLAFKSDSIYMVGMFALILVSFLYFFTVAHGAYFVPPMPIVEWTIGNGQYVMNDYGVRFEDVNGDGLVDFVIGLNDNADNQHNYRTYLNTGCQWLDASGPNFTLQYCKINATVVAPIRTRLQSLQYLSPEELALMIGVEERHIHDAIQSRELVARKIGPKWLILKSSVDSWLLAK